MLSYLTPIKLMEANIIVFVLYIKKINLIGKNNELSQGASIIIFQFIFLLSSYGFMSSP